VGRPTNLLVEPRACGRMFKDSNKHRVGARTSNHHLVYKDYCAFRECHLLWRFHRAYRGSVKNLIGHQPDPTKVLLFLPFPSPLPPACLLSDTHLAACDRQGPGWLLEGPPDPGPLAHSLRLRASVRPLHRPETRVRPLHRAVQSHLHRERQVPRLGDRAEQEGAADRNRQ
jgi:hypothetical protein